MVWEENESANLVVSVVSSLCFPASAEETQDLCPVMFTQSWEIPASMHKPKNHYRKIGNSVLSWEKFSGGLAVPCSGLLQAVSCGSHISKVVSAQC